MCINNKNKNADDLCQRQALLLVNALGTSPDGQVWLELPDTVHEMLVHTGAAISRNNKYEIPSEMEVAPRYNC